MHLGSLESTQEGRVETLTLLSCSPNFPHASITRYTHAKHEPILNETGNLFQSLGALEEKALSLHVSKFEL